MMKLFLIDSLIDWLYDKFSTGRYVQESIPVKYLYYACSSDGVIIPIYTFIYVDCEYLSAIDAITITNNYSSQSKKLVALNLRNSRPSVQNFDLHFWHPSLYQIGSAVEN